jgi:NAD(P) transhydrogenase subunit alpha
MEGRVIIVFPKESDPRETRIAMIPQHVKQLRTQGASIQIERGFGAALGYSDQDYGDAGAAIVSNRKKMIAGAEMVVRIRKPSVKEIKVMSKGAVHISYLDPFAESELIDAALAANIDMISMELIPRTTLAQKMDAISSQASLAGYVAVIIGAARLNKIFPMMMTPAGTIAPSRVFVIGAGVAGLQAIASAKRLGARIEAFDTRPVVEEEVQSLGAKFIKIDLGETGQTKDGYAKALTDAQLQKQRDVMARHCAMADVVITTAQVFGRKAPLIVTRDMIRQMKTGSIIVDLAVESGGNVEGVQAGKEIVVNGVTLIGLENLPGRVALHASQMYSSNITNLILHFWDKEAKRMRLNLEDEIIKGCLVTHSGALYSKTLKDIRK